MSDVFRGPPDIRRTRENKTNKINKRRYAMEKNKLELVKTPEEVGYWTDLSRQIFH
jgi:hypothetical protein